jgi:hypothetical protein
MTNTNNTGNTATFKLPLNKKAEAERRVQRAIDQATKLGVDWVPTLTFGKVFHEDAHLRIEATLDYPELALSANWKIIARARLLNAGKDKRDLNEIRDAKENVVVFASRGVEVPADSWNVGNKCDHCNWVRYRNLVYVLECTAKTENNEVGDVVKVGSSCLEDFIGKGTLSLLNALEAVVRWGENTTDRCNKGTGKEKVTFPVWMFVALAIDSARLGEKAFDLYAKMLRGVCVLPVAKEAAEEAQVAADWILSEMKHDSNISRNVYSVFEKLALESKDIRRHARLMTYGLKMYREAMGIESTPAPFNAQAVGSKVTVDGTVRFTKSGHGQYGPWHLYKVADSAGNLFSWFSKTDLDLARNQSVSFTATYVGKDVYRGRTSFKVKNVKLSNATRVAA